MAPDMSWAALPTQLSGLSPHFFQASAPKSAPQSCTLPDVALNLNSLLLSYSPHTFFLITLSQPEITLHNYLLTSLTVVSPLECEQSEALPVSLGQQQSLEPSRDSLDMGAGEMND